MKLELLEGAAAWQLLQGDGFEAAWTALLDRCPWATANQHAGFVMPWYRRYADEYTPVLLLAREADQSLAGLLTLAATTDQRHLAPAGGRQAEYVGPLSRPAELQDFMAAAWQALHRRWPRGRLLLRYLPPGFPGDGLRGVPGVRLRDSRRPVMSLADTTAITASLQKKSNRSKLNRLRRLGDVAFAALTSPADLNRWLPAIERYCDLRQGAVNASLPFANDPHKADFHRDLMASGVLYGRVMTVGDELAAALLAYRNPGSAGSAVLVISPFFAQHSPGKLLLYDAALDLAEHGFAELDLTPGGDEWKNRFAHRLDAIREAEINFARTQAWLDALQAGIRRSAKGLLAALGISPAALGARLRGEAAPAAGRTWLAAPAGGATATARHDRVLPPAEAASRGPAWQRNDIDALLAFRPAAPARERQPFLAHALRLFEAGGTALSRCEGGGLAACGWYLPPAALPSLLGRDAAGQVGANTGLATGLYAATPQPEDLAQLLRSLADLARADGCARLVALVPAGQAVLDQALGLAGFAPASPAGQPE